MAEFAPGLFSKPVPTNRHLYSKEGVAGHRRTLSNNTETYQAFKANRGHRRTMSNSTVDFQRILATSPTAEKPLTAAVSKPPNPSAGARDRSKPADEDRMTPDSLAGTEEERKPTASPRKKKRAFVGMLDAAIMYFDEKQATYVNAYAFSGSQASGDSELSELRKEQESLEVRIRALEAENDKIRAENQRLTAERENYVLSIGSLNTKILDLQLVLDEGRDKKPQSQPIKRDKEERKGGSITAFARDDSESLDISEIKSESIQRPPRKEAEIKLEAPMRRPSGDSSKPQTPSFTKTAGAPSSRKDAKARGPIYFS